MITKREQEILQLIYEGMTTREISDNLFISEHTVKTHCKNIMRKLDVHNRVSLVRVCLSQGLVRPTLDDHFTIHEQ